MVSSVQVKDLVETDSAIFKAPVSSVFFTVALVHEVSWKKKEKRPVIIWSSYSIHVLICLVHLIITPYISCLSYAREPEARPLGWLALKISACMPHTLWVLTVFEKLLYGLQVVLL